MAANAELNPRNHRRPGSVVRRADAGLSRSRGTRHHDFDVTPRFDRVEAHAHTAPHGLRHDVAGHASRARARNSWRASTLVADVARRPAFVRAARAAQPATSAISGA